VRLEQCGKTNNSLYRKVPYVKQNRNFYMGLKLVCRTAREGMTTSSQPGSTRSDAGRSSWAMRFLIHTHARLRTSGQPHPGQRARPSLACAALSAMVVYGGSGNTLFVLVDRCVDRSCNIVVQFRRTPYCSFTDKHVAWRFRT